MEGYITLQQASEKWGISERRIRTLCTEQRIEGATKIGPIWVIPEGVAKPEDRRVKTGKYRKYQKRQDDK